MGDLNRLAFKLACSGLKPTEIRIICYYEQDNVAKAVPYQRVGSRTSTI